MEDKDRVAVQVGRLVDTGSAAGRRILSSREDDGADQALAHDLIGCAAASRRGDAGRRFAHQQIVGLAADAIGLQVRGILEMRQRRSARAVGDGLRHRVADAVLPRVQRESRAIQRGIADRYSRQEAADDATGGAAEVILNVRGVLAFARGVAHLRAGAVGARRAGQAAIDDRECNHQLARLLQAPAGILEIALLGLRGQRVQQARQHQRHHEQHDRQLDQAETGAAREALACPHQLTSTTTMRSLKGFFTAASTAVLTGWRSKLPAALPNSR